MSKGRKPERTRAPRESRISTEMLDEMLAGQDPREAFQEGDLLADLRTALVERVLDAEIEVHLEGEAARGERNHRNGHNRKRVLTGGGAMEVAVPRDRLGRLVLGAADALAVPQQDLNVTLSSQAIVLYGDVPGGAGLVAQLKDEAAFCGVVERARGRVVGKCGCDTSCYGCLRSYRNQFIHTQLDRHAALRVLEAALRRGGRS